MCLNVLQEVKEDPKEVAAVKVLGVDKVTRTVNKALAVAKDVREQAAVTATDSASKPSATRPKITCCNASANPTPVSTSLTNKVPVVTEALAVPEVPEVLVVPAAEDSEVVIMTDLTQAAQAALAVPEAKDSEEANSSFSKLARTTKPMPIKPRPVCLTHS